jgi:hypothetical protein
MWFGSVLGSIFRSIGLNRTKPVYILMLIFLILGSSTQLHLAQVPLKKNVSTFAFTENPNLEAHLHHRFTAPYFSSSSPHLHHRKSALIYYLSHFTFTLLKLICSHQSPQIIWINFAIKKKKHEIHLKKIRWSKYPKNSENWTNRRFISSDIGFN